MDWRIFVGLPLPEKRCVFDLPWGQKILRETRGIHKSLGSEWWTGKNVALPGDQIGSSDFRMVQVLADFLAYTKCFDG